MIVGLGVDLVAIDRLRAVHQRLGDRFLARVFFPEELAYARNHADPYPALAARFAAKEAFVKAFPGRAWITEVGAWGRPPRLFFKPRLAARIEEAGLVPHLSLSHEKTHAVAVVLLEKR